MKLLDALTYAAQKHGDQKYGDGIPYIKHCSDVVIVLQRFGISDEDILVAGALHDVLEDTDTTSWELEKEFGSRVTKLVELVSNERFGDVPKLTRKEKHLLQYPKIATDADAVLVKLGDRIANVESGGFISMYRGEHEYFKETLQGGYALGDLHAWREIWGSEMQMWNHLDGLLVKPISEILADKEEQRKRNMRFAGVRVTP